MSKDKEKETPEAKAEPHIQILKLASGEEVIGEVQDVVVQDRQIIVLSKPAVIILQPADNDKDGSKFSIGLAPYAPYAHENTIHIMPQHVIGVMQPSDQMKSEYKNHYGSSLITPKKEIIAPKQQSIIT
jgi:hypothetical protein